jgi:myo-inositol-1(or 4)-monophosphatase
MIANKVKNFRIKRVSMVNEDFFHTLPRMARILGMALLKISPAVVRDFFELKDLQKSLGSQWTYAAACRKHLQKQFGIEIAKYGLEENLISGDVPLNEHLKNSLQPMVMFPEIDGYTNFVNAIPHFSLITGIIKQGRVVTAIVYECVPQNIFWADEEQQGAFLHPQKALSISPQKILKRSFLATGQPISNKTFKTTMQLLFSSGVTSRMTGAPVLDLCYVASGSYDLFVGEHNSHPILDIGALMVKKARGTVWIYDQVMIAGNGMLVKQIKEIILEKEDK